MQQAKAVEAALSVGAKTTAEKIAVGKAARFWCGCFGVVTAHLKNTVQFKVVQRTTCATFGPICGHVVGAVSDCGMAQNAWPAPDALAEALEKKFGSQTD